MATPPRWAGVAGAIDWVADKAVLLANDGTTHLLEVDSTGTVTGINTGGTGLQLVGKDGSTSYFQLGLGHIGAVPTLFLTDLVNGSRIPLGVTGGSAGTAVATILDTLKVKRGASGQTNNLQEWTDETPTVLAKIDKSGNAFAPTVTPTGLTGGTTTVRLGGGTASVAPASGTWVTGDFVFSQTGHAYLCTAGGTPGTWVEVGTGTFAKVASNLSDLASLASARLNLGLGVIDDDAGATVTATASKTSLMAAPHSIPGGTLAAGDVLTCTFKSSTANSSGGSLNATHEITFGGQVVQTAVASAVATGTLAKGIIHKVKVEITATGAAGTATVTVEKAVNTDNAETLVAGDGRQKITNLTGLDTTGSLTMDHKVTHSSSSGSMSTAGLHSSLEWDRRTF